MNDRNVAGFTVSVKDGVIVDLKRMDRIIEIDTESRVSMGWLKAARVSACES